MSPREQKLLLDHDLIVFQHPFYWYSCPAIVKEWLDLVLENGWAYGPGGTRLAGKFMMSAVSTGGSEMAYHARRPQPFRNPQVLRPLRTDRPSLRHGLARTFRHLCRQARFARQSSQPAPRPGAT